MTMMRERSFRSVWLSDLHLGNADCRALWLLDFLDACTCEQLYLVGDVLDLWEMDRRGRWPATHGRVLAKLIALAAAGTRVVWLPGNHDEALRAHHGLRFGGVELLPEAIHETADGRRLWVVHGDGFDDAARGGRLTTLIGDHAYDLALFLNRWSRRLRRLCGLPYRSLALELKTRIGPAARAIGRYERAAAHEAARREVDGIVCGHIHKPELRTIDGTLYANCGDWIESCTALVEHADGRLQVLHWADEARVTHADVLDFPRAAAAVPAAAAMAGRLG